MTSDSGYWTKVTTHYKCVRCSLPPKRLPPPEHIYDAASVCINYHSDGLAHVESIHLGSHQLWSSLPKTFKRPTSLHNLGRNNWVSEIIHSTIANFSCKCQTSVLPDVVLPRFHELSGSLGSEATLSALHQVLQINNRDFFYDSSRCPYTLYRVPTSRSFVNEFITVQISPKLQFKVLGTMNGYQLMSMVADLEEISHRCRNEIYERIPYPFPEFEFLRRSF